MLLHRFSFDSPFHTPQNTGRFVRRALAKAQRSAIAGHSLRRLQELFDLHDPGTFARALSLLPVRMQLDALSLLPLPARLQLWPHLPCAVRRASLPLTQVQHKAPFRPKGGH